MLHHWIDCLVKAKEREQGQGLVEYALILLLVATVAIGALTLLGTAVSDLLDTVTGLFP